MSRIYVSSTFSDLQEQRERVRLVLRRMQHEDVAMEYYGATDERPLEKCLADVEACDLYIGIFAWRYGYIPPTETSSITELEYRQAVNTKKECLIFILDKKASWVFDLIEHDALDRIQAFREELAENHVVDFFHTSEELTALVTQAVSNWERIQTSATKHQNSFFAFEQQYRKQVAQLHKFIIPPTYNTQQYRVHIDDLYVMPRLIARGIAKLVASDLHSQEVAFSAEMEFTFSNFIGLIDRTVLLADPGGGKSTLADRICFELTTYDAQGLIKGKPFTPVLIVLRDYGLQKKLSHCSIIDYITQKARSDYQLQPPEEVFHYLLMQGHIAVIFDGLDELLETGYRQAITRDIEAFCNLYPLVPVLVTSRNVGYFEAPLDRDQFSIYRIAQLNESQILEYVRKWFTLQFTEFPSERERQIQALNRELQSIPPDIKFNPLMLSLICTIYQGEGYIPRNRPGLYEKCADLLFERRDRERQITYDLPIQAHIRPMIMYLAYWIYDDQNFVSGVSERKLVAKATEYLLNNRFENFDEAVAVAYKFIEFCAGRAWVFTDTGTTPDGERLYQFTHRTFLEFFTSAYLNRLYRTPDELLKFLAPKIAKREWNVVAQLAFLQMARDVDPAAENLIAGLIEQAQLSSQEEAASFLAFTAECLEFIIPKATTVRTLVTLCLDQGISLAVTAIEDIGVEEFYRDHNFYESDTFLSHVIVAFGDLDNENRYLVEQTLETELVARILKDAEIPALVAAEIGINLPVFSRFLRDIEDTKKPTYLQNLTKRIVTQCKDHLVTKLCPKYVRTCLDLFSLGEISIHQLVEWHGTQSLFEQYHYSVITGMYDREHVPHLLFDLCRMGTDPEEQHDLFQQLKEVGEILLMAPMPWAQLEARDTSMLSTCKKTLGDIDNGILFGMFTAMAFLHERWYELNGMHPNNTQEIKTPFPDYLYWVFVCRLGQTELDDAVFNLMLKNELDKSHFSLEQREFVEKWAYREVSVIAGN